MTDHGHESQTDPLSMESGTWEGEFVDSSGQRATIRIVVEGAGNSRAGRFELAFKTEDAPYVVSGPCELRFDGERVRFEVPMQDGDEQRTVSYSASLSDAGTHARQAIYGTIDEPPVDGLYGGPFIAFHYEEREPSDGGYGASVADVPPRPTVDDLLRGLRRRIGRIRLPVLRGGR